MRTIGLKKTVFSLMNIKTVIFSSYIHDYTSYILTPSRGIWQRPMRS